MIIDDILDEQELPVRCVFRLQTSYWKDQRGIHMRKSLTFMRRRSNTDNPIILEDADMVGADEVWPRLTNLDSLKDGLYVIQTCNERRDWESGLIEDYDYRLVPYSSQPPNPAPSDSDTGHLPDPNPLQTSANTFKPSPPADTP